MKRLPQGELEAQVMDVLWEADGWRTPRDVHVAITTARRAFACRPVSSRDVWTAQRMDDLLASCGDRVQALHHFAESISAKEARLLRRALDQRKKR